MPLKRLASLPVPPFSDDRTWLVPVGIAPLTKEAEKSGFLPLAGGVYGFSHLDVIIDSDNNLSITRIPAQNLVKEANSAKEKAEEALHKITKPRPNFASLDMKAWQIMGIINATPDSFSDGGKDTDEALKSAHAMAKAGASIIDIGGESTRPGAKPIAHSEEEKRILPVIKPLASEGHLVSADTRHCSVMDSALKAGAKIINDVGGLRDEGAPELIAKTKSSAIVMHMQGEPASMQASPSYQYAPTDIFDWFETRLSVLRKAGIAEDKLAIDPGFGFGKSAQHNMQIMANLALFHGLGVPLMIGVSRKSSIAQLSANEGTSDRLPGSLALTTLARQQGVQIFRSHDVAETAQALSVAESMLLSYR